MVLRTAWGHALSLLAVGLLALGLRAGLDADAGAEVASDARAARLALSALDAAKSALSTDQDELAAAHLALAEGIAAQAAAGLEPTRGRAEVHAAHWTGSAWTISATVGAEWSEAAASLGPEARVWTRGRVAWAAAAAVGEGSRRIARSGAAERAAAIPDLGAGVSALVALATREAAPRGPSRGDGVAMAFVLLCAAALAWVVSRRFDGPVRAALDAAEAWRAGVSTAVVGVRGGPTARAISAALASVEVEAERRVARALEATELDGAQLAAALAALGKGDLAPREPARVAAPLAGVAQALVGARSDLAERLQALHRAASMTARAARDALDAHVTAARATDALSTGLDALDGHVAETRAKLVAQRDGARTALVALGEFAEQLRRGARELRADLTALMRGSGELSSALLQFRARAEALVDADEGLDLLGRAASTTDPIPLGPGLSAPSAQVLATVRRGRAALAELRGDAEALASSVSATARELARIASAAPPAVADAPPAALSVARDAIGAHLASAERLAELLGELSAALARLDGAHGHGDAAMRRIAERSQPLREALAAWDLGGGGEVIELAPPEAEGEPRALAALREAARASQARLDELLALVEREAAHALDS